MKVISDAPAAVEVYLPTEIVLQIVSIVAASSGGDRRQKILYNCSLVSRQWYSATTPYLYEKPRLESGTTFQKFTAVVCPPVGAPKSRTNLGSLVRRLDMSRLVHHSSNSVTARLLGRVKENLEVFIAPAASFSLNCLASLSKCSKLRYLDLSLVNDSIPFNNIRKSVSRMERLTTLRVARFTSVDNAGADNPKWPSNLQRLQMSGSLNAPMECFVWPQAITGLSLQHCSYLSRDVVISLLFNPHLSQRLKRLTVSTYNRGLQPESIPPILALLPNLVFLNVPGDLVQDSLFNMIQVTQRPLGLEVLEFGLSHTGDGLEFSLQSLISTLDGGLSHLRAVGFHDMYVDKNGYVDLNDALTAHAAEMGERLHISDETAEYEVGTYYF